VAAHFLMKAMPSSHFRKSIHVCHEVASSVSIILQYHTLYLLSIILDAILLRVCTLADPGAYIMLGEYQPRDSENHKPGLLLR